MPEAGDFLCGNWAWDHVLRELRNYRRKGKGWEDQPESAERLQPVKSVTWHRWSQAPMASHTGQPMASSLSRIVAAYEAGGNLTINEFDRDCAGKLATAIADAYGLKVIEEGAPDGRRGGNLPQRDQMGRLVTRLGRQQVILDDSAGEIVVEKPKRPFGKSRRVLRTTEIRRLELAYSVKGPVERYEVLAIAGPEEERIPVAGYEGYEGWADPEEWRTFTQELGRRLGVEAVVP